MTKSLRSQEPVNSPTYWDDRFSSNWEAFQGPEQSRQFMEALLKFLPAGVYEEIASSHLSLLDCGCAEGDGAAVLKEAFPRSQVAGFDFSPVAIERGCARFPSLDLFVASFTSLDRTADVLISSNCFEHLDNPLASLAHLALCARRYLMLLVPFLERFPPDPEHVRIVHATTFPERIADWKLTQRILVPPLPIWSQHQILFIYQPAVEAGDISEASRLEEQANLLLSLAARVEQMRLELRQSLPEKLQGLRATSDALGEARHSELALEYARLVASCQQQNEELRALCQALEALRREKLTAVKYLEAGLESQKRDNLRLQKELEEAKAGAEASHTKARETAQEREQLMAELHVQRTHLALLDSSLAVRSVHRLWAILRRVFPAGTLRHRVYRRLTQYPKRLLMQRDGGEPRPPEASRTPPEEAAEPAESPGRQPDFWSELQRFEHLVRETEADTIVVLFSGTMLREDEGQRPTQLAVSLAQNRIPVVFAYWRWDRNEWCLQNHWDKGILQIPIDVAVANPDRLAGLFQGCRRIALFEFPYPGFFEPLAALNATGWITVYDVLDDWEEFHRVGQAVWYDESFERHLMTATDAVFAINATIAERAKRLGRDLAQVVPNGFRPGIELTRDCQLLERGEVTVGYFGFLAGAWFDWDLVLRAAYRKPGWRFYLIGYGGNPEGLRLPSNVVLLGKKPQRELASYAQAWDVAIVPFKSGRLAAGADPIKTYEFLAMGLPVVVTGVHPPRGGEGLVARAEGLEEFLARVAEAAQARGVDTEPRRSYAAMCTWDGRLEVILKAIFGSAQRVAEKQSLFRETA